MELRLLRRLPVVDNIWSHQFQPAQTLSWTAGQFIRVELPHNRPDETGTRRRFTISSAPHQGIVQITTRLTASSFKQALAQLPIGGRLHLLDLPAGDFIWQSSPQPLVFVAHGVGITPFYSQLTDRLHHQQPLAATLLYSNRPGTGIPFAHELQHWAQTHPEFRLYQQDTPFTADRLIGLIPQLAESTIYVSGPQSLLRLLASPVRLPARQLKQDFFPGYAAADY